MNIINYCNTDFNTRYQAFVDHFSVPITPECDVLDMTDGEKAYVKFMEVAGLSENEDFLHEVASQLTCREGYLLIPYAKSIGNEEIIAILSDNAETALITADPERLAELRRAVALDTVGELEDGKVPILIPITDDNDSVLNLCDIGTMCESSDPKDIRDAIAHGLTIEEARMARVYLMKHFQ